MKTAQYIRVALTAFVLLLAVLIGWALWQHYFFSPWTRDGRIRAYIVRIAPDVPGLVTQVNVVDNQTVKKGDVLFVIDQARYQDALDQAKANLAAAQAKLRAAGADIDAAKASTTSICTLRSPSAARRCPMSCPRKIVPMRQQQPMRHAPA
jgi:multidrug resistance efflux pump